MPVDRQYDALIIGGGHNGLVLGSYLAKAGLRTLVFERRLEIGGGLSTEEITVPGFWHNLHSYFHDTINVMPPYEDLELESHNARYFMPPVQAGTILPDGRSLCFYDDLDRTCESIARFSARDAATWRKMRADYGEYMQTVIMPALYSPPSLPSEMQLVLESTPEGMTFLRLARMSPRDVVDEHFENEHVKALILHHLPIPRGILHDYAGIGTVVPLVVSQVERSQICLGGSHVMAHALWRALLKNGGDVASTRHVRRILVEDGTAVGVETDDGAQYRGTIVASAIDLKQTFLDLVDARHLDAAFIDRVKAFRLDEFSVFAVHLALREAPRFRTQPGYEDVNAAFRLNIGFDSVADWEDCLHDIRRRRLPREIRLIASVPTVHDPSQAPAGHHTAFLWQLVPGELEGASWDDVKWELMERCIAKWREYAPNLDKDNILMAVPQTPADIAGKMISMAGGGVFMGRMHMAQLEHFRPLPELAQFRTPIKNLYLAGACMHPGGGIIAGPGLIAADVIAADHRLQKWWD